MTLEHLLSNISLNNTGAFRDEEEDKTDVELDRNGRTGVHILLADEAYEVFTVEIVP